MGRWDERIVPVLDHARREAHCKTLGLGVELADHRIALPYSHQSNRVCVDSCHEECHGAACAHGACDGLF